MTTAIPAPLPHPARTLFALRKYLRQWEAGALGVPLDELAGLDLVEFQPGGTLTFLEDGKERLQAAFLAFELPWPEPFEAATFTQSYRQLNAAVAGRMFDDLNRDVRSLPFSVRRYAQELAKRVTVEK